MGKPTSDRIIYKIRFTLPTRSPGTGTTKTVYYSDRDAAYTVAKVNGQQGTLLYFGSYVKMSDLTDLFKEG